MDKPRRAAVALLAVALSSGDLAGSAPPHAPISFRSVVLSGAPAPGQGAGVTIDALTTPLNHSFLVPRIDGAGRVAFQAMLAGPGVDGSNSQSMWIADDGQLGLLARGGDAAPGTGPGVRFAGVPNLEVPFPPEFAGGRAVFAATLAGPDVDISDDQGLWTGTPGAVELVIREDDPAPGLAGVRFGLPHGRISPAGDLVVFSDLRGAGVTGTSNSSVWSDRSGTLELLFREGAPAPLTEPGSVFGDTENTGTAGVFRYLAFDDATRLTLVARIIGPAVHSRNDELLYVERNGALELVAREGQPAPGLPPGVTMGGNAATFGLRFVSLNNGGRVAFNADLGGSVPTQTAMFSDRSGALTVEVARGDAAPGGSFTFSLLGNPLLNDADRIAFAAALPDNDGDPFTPPPFGVWSDVDGALDAVVLPGDTTSAGETISNASVVGLNAAGDILASITLESPTFRRGLALRSPGGGIDPLVLTGDRFDVGGNGQDLRDVVRVVAGSLNEAGEVAFRLDFADGSSGHFVAFRAAPGDVDGDGDVDLDDLLLVLTDFGCSGGGCGGDADGDGDTDLADLLTVLANFGN